MRLPLKPGDIVRYEKRMTCYKNRWRVVRHDKGGRVYVTGTNDTDKRYSEWWDYRRYFRKVPQICWVLSDGKVARRVARKSLFTGFVGRIG